ncbi:MAG TPA: methionyl-tRNA formyltransferase [Clostridia bacterium]|nr:methionyl-tRNA formyltransferase [Clostridia bacterium]
MSMRLVYMGTPEFAVPPLQALLEAGHEILAVCTQPDRPKGRKKEPAACPVKVFAQSRGIAVIQLERLRSKEGVETLRALAPDLFVTAAFGQILSKRVLEIPKMGTVNLHASLLPAYRGPAPINWCIIQGETMTGVTTMMTDAGIDTGDMLLSKSVDILPGETADALSERLSRIGAELLVETLERLERGDCPRTPQDPAQASYHPMLDTETGRIDWGQPAQAIVNRVRGVTSSPGAFTHTPQGILKIWEARVYPGQGTPGQVLLAQPKAGLVIACADRAVEIVSLQAPGSKRMAAKDYLRGHEIDPNVPWGGAL